MKRAFYFFLLSGLVLACQPSTSTTETAQASLTSKTTKMDQKEKAIAFVQAVCQQDANTVRQLADTGYIQHNPFLPTGLEPFIGLFPILQANGTQAEQVRVLADGDYVVLHHLWTGAKPFGADEMASFDILRFDQTGTIVEHWDALMPLTPPNPSNRSLLDGATEVKDLDQTEKHRQIAKNLFQTIINGTPEEVGARITETFLPDYLQHNPVVADGIPAIFEAFGREQWVYHTNHKILAEGNFVLSVSEGTAQGVPTVFYDLLRFENGKVAEHWDVIQTIPSENLANQNTMFGFK